MESNPNPQMRPSIDKLVHKLNNLSVLRHHPDAVEYVIGAIAHHAFVFDREHPDHLFRLIGKMDALWHLAKHTHAEERNMFDTSLQAQELRKPETDQNVPDKKSTEFSKDLFLADRGLRKEVRHLIFDHNLMYHDNGRMNCSCGLPFDLREQWTVHVRVLIWKAMKEYEVAEPGGTREGSETPDNA